MTTGVLVPLVTPLGPSGAVVEDDVRRLIESVGEEATALMPCLSTGEGWRLSAEQWEDMVSATLRHAFGLPVYVGVERPTTAAVVEFARVAAGLGVDAVVATTPFVPALDGDAVIEHFRAVLDSSGGSLLIYNESALSGNACSLDVLLKCCALAGVIGVKESSGVAATAADLLEAEVAVPVYQGWEHLIGQPPGLAGCAVSLSNIEPAWCRELAEAPSARARESVDRAYVQYRLDADDWYRHLKIELVRRSVLSSSRTAAATEQVS